MFVRERFHGLALFFKNSVTIFREEAISALRGFHAAPLSWSNWNLKGWFLWKEEPGERRQPTTNSTHIWSWATLVGDERSHHCAIPAPQAHRS